MFVKKYYTYFMYVQRYMIQAILFHFFKYTLKSRFSEFQFNEILRFCEQMPASLKYFTLLKIRFSELHDLVKKVI